MNTRNTRIFPLLLTVAALLLGVLLSSCGSAEAAYKNDITASAIADAVNPKLSGIANLDPADDSYIKTQQQLPVERCADYLEMFQTSGVGIDEYGVFHMNTADDITAMKEACQAYLKTALASFNENYAPNERPKIESAEVRVFGNYVVYAVLSNEDKEVLFSTVESLLRP